MKSYSGVDVSKHFLDVYFEGEYKRLKNDNSGFDELAKAMNPEAQILLADSAEKMKELLKRRDQLLHDKQAEQQRLDKATLCIKTLINRHIKWLAKEIDMLDQELSKIRSNDKAIHESHQRFTSVPGIGDLVAYHLIAYLPELGTANNKQLAALTGVAPFNRDSGSTKGKRYIWGGRKELRRILYMAAISAMQWNPDMSAFYNRLRSNGKSGKLVLVAVIRKLLCLLNSIEKRKGSWEKIY